MSFDTTAGGLPQLDLPALGTDWVITSRNGTQLVTVRMADWPVSTPVALAINGRLQASDLATINGQSLIQPGGNIVIETDPGGGTWGTIAGTLSDQTDLWFALGGKATSAQGALAGTAAQPNAANTFLLTQTFSKSLRAVWDVATFSPTLTLDMSLPALALTMTANSTMAAVSNLTTGDRRSVDLFVTQDATGGRTLTYDTALFKADGGVFPALSTIGGAADLLRFTALPDGTTLVSLVARIPAPPSLLLINSGGDQLLINSGGVDKLLIS